MKMIDRDEVAGWLARWLAAVAASTHDYVCGNIACLEIKQFIICLT